MNLPPQSTMPAARGTYLLILHVVEALPDLAIGQLGRFTFTAGYYLYVGSAFDSGGLAARLKHHYLRDKPHMHWHIDYLRAKARLCEIWSTTYPQPLETQWCQALHDAEWLTQPIPRFGASDTRNPTHLFYTPTYPSLKRLSHALLAPLDLLASEEPWLISVERLP